MPTKRPKSAPKTDPRRTVVTAAIKLAAKGDWANIGLKDIAKEAGLSLADLSAQFAGKEDILLAYGRIVDADVLAQYPNGVPGTDEKDRLFDVLMARFDRLQDDRAGLTSIIKAACADPKQAIISLPGVAGSMSWTLEVCDIDTQGTRGALRVLILSAIYLWILRSWMDDDSADMAKTMAVLDRTLNRAGQWAETLGF